MVAAFLPMLAAAAPTSPYPAEAVLAAFATACATAEDFAVARAGLLAGGWQAVPEDDSNPLGKLTQLGRNATAKMEGAKELAGGGSFARIVAGRTLYVSLSGVDLEGFIAKGCRLYDFSAPEVLSADQLKDWAVREPNDRKEPAPGIVETTWNPGLKPGHMEMKILFVPQDSKLGTALGVTGLSMATSVLDLPSARTDSRSTD